jgi:hypothetical protein
MSSLYVNTLQALTGSQVSLTGSLSIQQNLTVGGTFTATVSTSSYSATASFVGPTLNQNLILSGSVVGVIRPLSVSSNTASMDCSIANFFSLPLTSSTTTHLVPSNLTPGQTINLKITQAAGTTGSISFAGTIKQPFGSTYTASTTGSAVDVLTFINYDTTSSYMAAVKNLL